MNFLLKYLIAYPVKGILRGLKYLSPEWYYENFWQYGEQEAIVRRRLLEKCAECKSSAKMKELIEEAHEITLTFLSFEHGGLFLEDYIKAGVWFFSRWYTVVLALLVFRIESETSLSSISLKEDLMQICGEKVLLESLWSSFGEHKADQNKQALAAWDECVGLRRAGEFGNISFFKGCFVILMERVSKRLNNNAKEG